MARGRTLTLVEYDPAWPARFAHECVRLRGAVAAHVLAIEHVGSTAIPGMISKPVLDIAISVADEASADACVSPLQALGYEYRGPYGDDPRRRYYVLAVDGQRTVHVHLYILPARAWDEKLAFRDALRADAALADAYAAEKRRVADAVAWDKAAYSDAKGPFIASVLRRIGLIAPPHAMPTQRDH
jgi:GrpB-like predicted nucleotidyltransferase (UPF0157 family)